MINNVSFRESNNVRAGFAWKFLGTNIWTIFHTNIESIYYVLMFTGQTPVRPTSGIYPVVKIDGTNHSFVSYDFGTNTEVTNGVNTISAIHNVEIEDFSATSKRVKIYWLSGMDSKYIGDNVNGNANDFFTKASLLDSDFSNSLPSIYSANTDYGVLVFDANNSGTAVKNGIAQFTSDRPTLNITEYTTLTDNVVTATFSYDIFASGSYDLMLFKERSAIVDDFYYENNDISYGRVSFNSISPISTLEDVTLVQASDAVDNGNGTVTATFTIDGTLLDENSYYRIAIGSIGDPMQVSDRIPTFNALEPDLTCHVEDTEECEEVEKDCFDNYLGIRNECTDLQPSSGIYIDDIQMMNLELFSELAHNMTGVQYFRIKEKNSIKQVINDLLHSFSSSFNDILKVEKVGGFTNVLSQDVEITSSVTHDEDNYDQFVTMNTHFIRVKSDIAQLKNFTFETCDGIFEKEVFLKKCINTIEVNIEGDFNVTYNGYGLYKANTGCHCGITFENIVVGTSLSCNKDLLGCYLKDFIAEAVRLKIVINVLLDLMSAPNVTPSIVAKKKQVDNLLEYYDGEKGEYKKLIKQLSGSVHNALKTSGTKCVKCNTLKSIYTT